MSWGGVDLDVAMQPQPRRRSVFRLSDGRSRALRRRVVKDVSSVSLEAALFGHRAQLDQEILAETGALNVQD